MQPNSKHFFISSQKPNTFAVTESSINFSLWFNTWWFAVQAACTGAHTLEGSLLKEDELLKMENKRGPKQHPWGTPPLLLFSEAAVFRHSLMGPTFAQFITSFKQHSKSLMTVLHRSKTWTAMETTCLARSLARTQENPRWALPSHVNK